MKHIDASVFKLHKEHIEIDLAHTEKATPEALKVIRAYLDNPSEDITGLRLLTLIDRAHGLAQAYAHIEANLKRLQELQEEGGER